ncbi:MAG: hypothetical protein JW940_04635 [Polyangiaceae bacterium]|nr:hypothetical protein [Polyangiaceae bacterium]
MRQRFIRTLAVAIAVLIVMLAPLARAADPRVVLVVGTRERTTRQATSSAEARIRAELLADGLDVIIVVEPNPADATTLQSATVRTHSIAAISVSEKGDLARAQIWLSAGPDREAGLSQVDSEGEPDERDRLFALRVADFLYASLVELEPYRKRRERAAEAGGGQTPHDEAAGPVSKPSEKASVTKPPRQPAEPRERAPSGARPPDHPSAAVGLGGTFWAGFGSGEPGFAHAVAPTLTGGWWPARRWRIGGVLSGPAVASIKQTATGSALVDQELFAAELLFTAYQGHGWMVGAAVSGGTYRIGASGDADFGYRSASGVRLRPFGMVGAAWRAALQQNLWLVLRVDSALVTQPIIVRFADVEEAHTAFPLLLASVGFEVTW